MGLVQTIQALINGENHAAHPPQTQPAVKTRPQPRLRVGPQRVPSPPNIDFGPWNIPIDNPRLWNWTVNRDTSIFQNSVRDRPALPVTRDYQMARVIDAQVPSPALPDQGTRPAASKRQLTVNDGAVSKKPKIVLPRKANARSEMQNKGKQRAEVQQDYQRVGRIVRRSERPVLPVSQVKQDNLHQNMAPSEPSSSRETVMPEKKHTPPPVSMHQTEEGNTSKRDESNRDNRDRERAAGRPIQSKGKMGTNFGDIQSLVVKPKKSNNTPKVVKFALQQHGQSADMDQSHSPSPTTRRPSSRTDAMDVDLGTGPSTKRSHNNVSRTAEAQSRTLTDVLHIWKEQPDRPACGGDLAIVFAALFQKMEGIELTDAPVRKASRRRSRALHQATEEDVPDIKNLPLPNRSRVKHREGTELELQEHIRTTCAMWMGRADNKSPFTLPDDRALKLYEAVDEYDNGPSIDPNNPKAHPWRYDVAHPVTSKWNQRCIDLFVEEYLKVPDCKSHKRIAIRHAVTTHWKALNLQWKVLNRNDMNKPDKEKLATQTLRGAQCSRRTQLFRRRTLGLQQHNLSHKFLRVVKASGAGAQSDDELVVIGGTQYARTKTLEWRSQAFIEVLKLADNLHLSTKFYPDGRPNTHVFPRARIAGGGPSQRQPVKDLPQNCYDEGWKKKQTTAYLESLRMRAAIDLSIADEVQRFAAAIKAKSVGKQLDQENGDSDDNLDDDSDDERAIEEEESL